MELRVSVDIEARPEEVWQVMSDIERWPEWTPSIDAVSFVDGAASLGIGVRARIKQPKVPAMVWTVTELTPNRSFTWTNRAMGIASIATHSIEPTQRGSRVTLAVQQSGLLVHLMPWMKSMSRRYVEMEAGGLKQRSEKRALVH